MNVYILNFQAQKELDILICDRESGFETNLDCLLNTESTVEWSVKKNITVGDIVLFMCAVTSFQRMGSLRKEAERYNNTDLLAYVNQKRGLFKKHAGTVLAMGVVQAEPFLDPLDYRWYAEIGDIRFFETTIHHDEFKDFIKVSRFESVTKLTDEQWMQFQDLMNGKGAVPVSRDDTLPKDKFGFKFAYRIVTTKEYNRDPVIAEHAKIRANGICQLCEQPAPFQDVYGKPFLESHHIKWLSDGGEDSLQNTVALCPNCHRKMHHVGDPQDVQKLQEKARDNVDN